MRWLPLALIRLASPPAFYAFANSVAGPLALVSIVLFVAGAYGSLFLAPTDFQQGEGYRIIFVHVPAAWMSLMMYMFMAVCGGALLLWRSKVAGSLMSAAAIPGASFTALALITGSLWGKPMWGTFWVWDARLTSELILLFLYLGFLALRQSLPDPTAAKRAAAVLLLVGTVNIPIIHYSVEWWNTLHQPATITRLQAPAIHPSMLIPLLLMAITYLLYGCALTLRRARAEILSDERHMRWAKAATDTS